MKRYFLNLINCFMPKQDKNSFPISILTDRKNIIIGKNSRILEYCVVRAFESKLIIGDDTTVNAATQIHTGLSGVKIGNKVLIGPCCCLMAINHGFNSVQTPILEQCHNGGGIVIEDDVWLGANVTVLPDVTIGMGSVVGAGSVVTKSIPQYAIAVGNPARVIRYRK